MTDVFYGQGYVDHADDVSVVEEADLVPQSNFEKVTEFMNVFGQEVKTFPEFPSEEIQKLRIDLIEEELGELKDAIAAGNVVEVADALTDILYVVYGAGCAFGIDLDACFAEVHASNMSKLGEDGQPIRREDGKVMKGPNYFKPDLFAVLFQNQPQAEDPEALEIVSVNGRPDGLYDVVFRDSIGVEHVALAEYDEATGYLNLR